ncbi:hypothetical protein [Thioflexithrix psekupsensis]|uniref:Lipoprotein n=1 Tax=Thioflexithrix psekupsensis TaxID=1570016 RepID=A0A251X4H6_9GAMM|nr:hypothetical protein [Thioflexithrix psekupsensis]OUD12099.1 hypothetical protein TPSD3_13305 [Thioflexithrix psekupsensis]
MKFFIQKLATIFVITSSSALTTACAEGGDEYAHLLEDKKQEQAVDATSLNQPPTFSLDKNIVELLGVETTGVLSSPDSVQAYQLEFEPKTETPPVETFSGFPVVGENVALNKAQIEQLQSIIFNYANYNFEYAEKCGFYPQLGFSFHQAKEQVDLLLDVNCKKWQFSHQAKLVSGSYYEETMPVLIGLFKELFNKSSE